jgi:HD domain
VEPLAIEYPLVGGAPENTPNARQTNAGGSSKRPAAARAYVWGVVAMAVAALACWGLFFGFSLEPTTLAVAVALAVLCAAERFWPVSFGVGKATFEFGGIPIFAAFVLGGPTCALLTAVPSAAYRDGSRAAFQGAIHALQIVASALAFSLFVPTPLLTGLQFSVPFVWGTLAAGAVFFGLDALLGPVLMRLKYGLSWREVLGEVILPALPSDLLAVAAVLAMALAAGSIGPLAALVLLSGTALSLAAASQIRDQRKKMMRLEAERDALGDALRSSHAKLAARLVGELGSRDGHAAAHAAASAVYARDIAREMGLGKERSEEVHLAALLMDVGLLWVPDEVLLTRPEKLNSLGRTRLEGHPESGERVLSAVPGLEEASRWVRWHHERPDGTGYPDRLRGGWIPLEARILAAASLYASLVLDDPHTPALRPDEARQRLVGAVSGAVDEGVARVLLRVLDSEDASYASASDARFSFLVARREPKDTPTEVPSRVIRAGRL